MKFYKGPYHVPSPQPCYFIEQPQGHHKVGISHSCFPEEKLKSSSLSEILHLEQSQCQSQEESGPEASDSDLLPLPFFHLAARRLEMVAGWVGRHVSTMTPIRILSDTSQIPPVCPAPAPPTQRGQEYHIYFLMKTLRHQEVK